jgi:hypothetical protein
VPLPLEERSREPEPSQGRTLPNAPLVRRRRPGLLRRMLSLGRLTFLEKSFEVSDFGNESRDDFLGCTVLEQLVGDFCCHFVAWHKSQAASGFRERVLMLRIRLRDFREHPGKHTVADGLQIPHKSLIGGGVGSGVQKWTTAGNLMFAHPRLSL